MNVFPHAAGRSPRGSASNPTLILGLVCSLSLLSAACAKPAATLLILQNQVPKVEDDGTCVISAEAGGQSRVRGRFDVDLDRAYPYFLYPVVQNRLPPIKTAGVERNVLSLRRIDVVVKAPRGVDPRWPAGCPANFWASATARLDPGATLAFPMEGFLTCHAEHIRQLIADGAIPAGTGQPVYFTLELTAVADHNTSEQVSDVFPFDVQVCAGCLQPGYPLVPACADAPRPNPLPGNPCNIAQDEPQVLCCTQPSGALVCPAPDA